MSHCFDPKNGDSFTGFMVISVVPEHMLSSLFLWVLNEIMLASCWLKFRPGKGKHAEEAVQVLTNQIAENERGEEGVWAHSGPEAKDVVMEGEQQTLQGQAQQEEKKESQGQAKQEEKEESQGQAKQEEKEESQGQAAGAREDEVNDKQEQPNVDTRPWFCSATETAQLPMAPFNAFSAPRPKTPSRSACGARLPSQDLVVFLEAMTDLMQEYNLWYHLFMPGTLQGIQRVPKELLPYLNGEDTMVTDICWQHWVEAILRYNPYSGYSDGVEVPCFQLATSLC